MLFNYIKIAFRNMARHKVYSIINIMGLAIGMACAILLLLFVRDELSYDRYNSKYKRIYMVQTHEKIEILNKDEISDWSGFPMGPALQQEYPFIETSVRTYFSGTKICFVDQKKAIIGEDRICYADPTIFKVFDFKFIHGSPEGALDSPNTIVLSESLAVKYFGELDPTGKIISTNSGAGYIVKGVYEDLPRNSSKRYSALISMKNITEAIGAENYARLSNSFFPCPYIYTYILLAENANIKDITADHKRFREKYISRSIRSSNDEMEPVFMPLVDAYLHSKTWSDSPINILQRVYILSALALFILIIACINYMNLATAKSAGRSREVGVRKVLGADRASLIRQFICESIIITAAAMLISLVLVEVFLPTFNSLAGKELDLGSIGKADIFSCMLALTLFVGLIAGSYPAFVLSSFLPVKVLRGGIKSGADRGLLRKTLVVIQYTISVVIIITTILLIRQISYIRNMDLGFNAKNVFIIDFNTEEESKSIPVFKEKLAKHSGILAVAGSSGSAGVNFSQFMYDSEDKNGKPVVKSFDILHVDYNFIDLMKMKILEGRSFSPELESDLRDSIMVNEAFVEEMRWTDSPIGKRLQLPGIERKVIGVLKNFHFMSLREKIEPMVILPLGYAIGNGAVVTPNVLSMKISPTDYESTMKVIKSEWYELNPMYPFEISSLEDIINSQYRTDEAASRLFTCSAFLGIFISCLGLFGLSSFIAENKTKEIGVRKVFGASVWSIVSSLSFNFLKLVLISSIIAWPIAYYIMAKWLENFAYKIEMSWWLFVVAACIAMLIAIMTVSYHAIKAALTDPVKALRYE